MHLEKSFTILNTCILNSFNSCSTFLSFCGFLEIEMILNPYFAKTFAKPNPIPSVEPVIKTHDPIPYLVSSLPKLESIFGFWFYKREFGFSIFENLGVTVII